MYHSLLRKEYRNLIVTISLISRSSIGPLSRSIPSTTSLIIVPCIMIWKLRGLLFLYVDASQKLKLLKSLSDDVARCHERLKFLENKILAEEDFACSFRLYLTRACSMSTLERSIKQPTSINCTTCLLESGQFSAIISVLTFS